MRFLHMSGDATRSREFCLFEVRGGEHFLGLRRRYRSHLLPLKSVERLAGKKVISIDLFDVTRGIL